MKVKQPVVVLLCAFLLTETSGMAQRITDHFNRPVMLAQNGFDRITISGNIDVMLESSFPEDAGVKAEQPVIDKLKIEIKGTALFISPKIRLKDNERLSVYITTDKLKSITLKGAAFIASREIIDFPDLVVNMDSESRLSLRARRYIKINAPYDNRFEEEYFQVYTIDK